MVHRGVEYTVISIGSPFWKWQFQIGDHVVSGKTEAALFELAAKRVELRINQALLDLAPK